MSKITDSATVAMKAQAALMKAELKRSKMAMGLYSVTIGCFLLGVIAVNMAVFFMMTGNADARDAASIIGLCNILLGLIPAISAARIKVSDEERLLLEIRDQASQSITQPFSSTSIDKIGVIAPLLNIVLKNFRK